MIVIKVDPVPLLLGDYKMYNVVLKSWISNSKGVSFMFLRLDFYGKFLNIKNSDNIKDNNFCDSIVFYWMSSSWSYKNQYMYMRFFCRRCVFNLTMKIVCRTWSIWSAEMILIGLLGNCLSQLLVKANFSYHHVITRSCKQYNSWLGKFPIHPIFLQSYVRGICVLIKQVGLSLSGIEPISYSVSFEIPRS